MKAKDIEKARKEALMMYEKAHIVLTDSEKANIEIADFGLNDFYNTGLSLVTYVNTKNCCAKEMVLHPYQTCPEHKHAPIKEINYQGKEETFRVRYGKVYLYVEGEAAKKVSGRILDEYYTVFNEIELNPGQQYTLYPNTWHWFQAGKEGAVISEFSTSSYDECDYFTNPNIKRKPTVE